MTLVVALLFGSLVLLPAFLQGFIQSVSVPPLQHVTLRGGRACMFYEWMDVVSDFATTRDCIFFPGKAHAANSRRASSSLVRMDWF